MNQTRARHISSVDHQTGELLDGVIAWQPKRHYFQEGHFTMFQDVLEKLAKMDLPQRDMQVLMFLMSKMDMENACLINQKAVAEELNMRTSNLSRSIRNLADKKIIIKGEGKVGRTPTLRLNNTLLWKGKTKVYKMIAKDEPIGQEEARTSASEQMAMFEKDKN
jgi:predicted transcriptional regulator